MIHRKQSKTREKKLLTSAQYLSKVLQHLCNLTCSPPKLSSWNPTQGESYGPYSFAQWIQLHSLYIYTVKKQDTKAHTLIICISMKGNLAVKNQSVSFHHSSLCKLWTKHRLVVSTKSNEIQNPWCVSHSFLEHNWSTLSLANNTHKWKSEFSRQAPVTQGKYLNAENLKPRTSFNQLLTTLSVQLYLCCLYPKTSPYTC